jgi:hypothetical protein
VPKTMAGVPGAIALLDTISTTFHQLYPLLPGQRTMVDPTHPGRCPATLSTGRTW